MVDASIIFGNLSVSVGNGYVGKINVIFCFEEVDEVVKVEFEEPTKNATEEHQVVFKENVLELGWGLGELLSSDVTRSVVLHFLLRSFS